MKAELFKKLIKEAVREAVREELSTLLSEEVKVPKTKEPVRSEIYRPKVTRPTTTGDPLMDLLNETKYSMTQGDYQSMIGGDLPMVDGGDYSSYNQGPEPGLDLSQFDFIKNAGAIYKASQDKDRQRHGL